MTTKEALYNYCLRLGDNNLILGQRMAEWCSRGPLLEEDLAMTNISLDLFGQAEAFYEYAAELKGKGTTPDQLAFHRDERHYYNYLLTEQPNHDFSFTMVRQWLFSTFGKHLYESLSCSVDERLAGLAARGLKEYKYHFRHSSEWVVRLGKGTEESHRRVQHALNELWMFTGDLFLRNETDKTLLKENITAGFTETAAQWKNSITTVAKEAHLELPESNLQITGGIDGNHTEYLGHVLCEMQYLPRTYPEAVW